MPPSPKAITPIGAFIVTIVVALTAIGITWNEYHSSSSDAGLHYGLVRNLMDRAEGQTDVPTLPFMSNYPPLAHWIAAQIGRLASSGLHGMTVIASISVALFYLAMFHITYRVARRAALFALAITVTYALLRGPVFGRMIVNNYFFAQVVASALIPAALIAATYLRHRKYWISADILVIAFAQILVFTHLLAALQLAAIYCFIVTVDCFRSRNWRPIARLLALSSTCILLTLQNPFIGTMYEASQLPASAHINHFNDRTLQLLLSAFGLYLSSKLLITAWGNRYAILLSCIGLGTSTVTLLHIMAQTAGLTTNYAISKTVFMTVASVIFIGASLLAQRGRRPQDTGSIARPGLASMVLCGALTLSAVRTDLYPSQTSLLPITNFQQGVRSAFAKIASDRHQALVLTSMWDKSIAFAIVYGDLRVPLDPAVRTLKSEDFPSDRFTIAFAPVSDSVIRDQCIDHALSNDQAIAMRYACLLDLRKLATIPSQPDK